MKKEMVEERVELEPDPEEGGMKESMEREVKERSSGRHNEYR